MVIPRARRRLEQTRIAGWRGWVARLAILVLALNLFLPATAMPRGPDLVPICTAEGMAMAPAPDGAPAEGGGHGQGCVLCPLAGGGPLLDAPPAPGLAALAAASLHPPVPACAAAARPCLPAGSLSARAPPALA